MSGKETDYALRLTDAANTYNPALVVLRSKEYHLYVVPDPRPQFAGDYWAIKDDRAFIAADPLRLLGLVALWEHLGDDWQDHVTDYILDEVEYIGYAKGDFRNLDDAAFHRLVDHLRLLFDAVGTPLPDAVTRSELAHLVRALGEEPEMIDDEDE